MLTVTAGELAHLLATTLPATADAEHYDPALSTVHLAASGGILTVTTTNRHVAVHARSKATGTLRPTLLHAADARLILARKRETNASWPVEIRATVDRISFSDKDTQLRFTPSDQLTGWPADKLADYFTRPADALPARLDLSIEVLRTLRQVLKAASQRGLYQRTRWTALTGVKAPVTPVKVEVGRWLAILVMPMRLPRAGENDYGDTSVPYGLPTEGTPA